MLQKGSQERYGYERLMCDEDQEYGAKMKIKKMRPRSSSRRCWVKKMNGRLIKGLRLSPRSRKLTLKAFSAVILPLPSKIIRMYGDVIERMKTDGLSPHLVFSAQWGLPVLSHPSLKCKRSTVT